MPAATTVHIRAGRGSLVGHPDAAARMAESSARFAGLGIDPGGWQVVLGHAVGTEPAEPAVR